MGLEFVILLVVIIVIASQILRRMYEIISLLKEILEKIWKQFMTSCTARVKPS